MISKTTVDYEACVREFMVRNKQHIGDERFQPPAEVTILRMRLMAEELGETMAAMHEKNIVEIADGLADLIYVAVGTAIAYGIPINDVFAEVQRSNMSKAPLNEHNKGGKVGKGSEFKPPRIAEVVFGHELKE